MAQVTCIKCGTMYEVNTQDKYTCMVCGTMLPVLLVPTDSGSSDQSTSIMPITTEVAQDTPPPPQSSPQSPLPSARSFITTGQQTIISISTIFNKIRSNKKSQTALIAASAIFLVILGILLISIDCSSSSESNANQITENSKEKYRKAIKSVLDQEAQITPQLSSNASMTELIVKQQQYLNGMRDIDLSLCPYDFQAAYREYINAWNDIHHASRRIKDFDSYQKSNMTFDAYQKSITTLEKYRSQLKKGHNNMNISKTKVLEIAVKYGVDVSKYR